MRNPFKRKQRTDGSGNPIIEFSAGDRFFLGLNGFSWSYSQLYRKQPAVHTVVQFLARNIAQLNLKTYQKVSRTDRVEVPDHPLAQLIQNPSTTTTRYRLIEALVSDLAIFDVAYWQKVETNPRSLFRIPPTAITQRFIDNRVVYQVTAPNAVPRLLDASELIIFRGYDPDGFAVGVSPLESLRRILAEDWASSLHREGFWENAARIDGVIERPHEAGVLSPEAHKRLKESWDAMHSGSQNAGKTALLEEGMHFEQASFSPKDSEFIDGRKLTREEVARAYHIPPPMVGILDNATFSNITEQHKMLYQDTLGPWLARIEQEIELQLFPWFELDGVDDLYVEFNIEEKLQGSFTDQAAALTSAIGRAWMTPNEGRGIRNLPRIDDPSADELATPLNVSVGGQPAPNVPNETIPKSLPEGVVELRAAD